MSFKEIVHQAVARRAPSEVKSSRGVFVYWLASFEIYGLWRCCSVYTEIMKIVGGVRRRESINQARFWPDPNRETLDWPIKVSSERIFIRRGTLIFDRCARLTVTKLFLYFAGESFRCFGYLASETRKLVFCSFLDALGLDYIKKAHYTPSSSGSSKALKVQ